MASSHSIRSDLCGPNGLSIAPAGPSAAAQPTDPLLDSGIEQYKQEGIADRSTGIWPYSKAPAMRLNWVLSLSPLDSRTGPPSRL